MDRTNEGASPSPSAQPFPVTAQPLRVTPDNVVELALLFRNAADRLLNELALAETALQLSMPWMDDDASRWMLGVFNEYFFDGENSFQRTLEAIHIQHDAHATALENAVALYGKTEELSAARHAQLHDPFPG